MNAERTVIVTGAAGGMGALFATRFLANGDTVIATDMTDDGLARLEDDTGRLHRIAADLTDPGDLDEIAQLAKETTGRVDVVVNNAGWFPVQPFEEIAAADWRKVLDVNLVAPALLVRAVLPQRIQDKAISVRALKREESPEDLVGTVFFLASPDADFVTGQTIIVDGGNEML